jgi:hypothetical protein
LQARKNPGLFLIQSSCLNGILSIDGSPCLPLFPSDSFSFRSGENFILLFLELFQNPAAIGFWMTLFSSSWLNDFRNAFSTMPSML